MASKIHITPGWLYTAGTILPTLCTLIVAARFVARRNQRRTLYRVYGVDDWLTIPALILVWGMAVTIIVCTAKKGMGYPAPKVAPGTEFTAMTPQQTVTRQAYSAITLLQIAALTFIKLSCMFFYLHVFEGGTHRAVTYLIYAMNFLIVAWGIGFFCSYIFACGSHFNYLWSSLANEEKCHRGSWNLGQVDLWVSISDVVMDVIILVFPLPLIARLQTSTSKKIAISAIFIVGALAIATSIVRVVIIEEELNVEFASSTDPDFSSTAGSYFMYIEPCFALLAICMPSLSKPLIGNIHNVVQGFSEALSNISRSLRSGDSQNSGSSTRNHERPSSSRSELPHSRPASAKNSRSATSDGSTPTTDADIEMYPFPADKGIVVDSRIHQEYWKA